MDVSSIKDCEQLRGTDSAKDAWKRLVWDNCKSCCSNCGSEDRLKERMIVPAEAGGKLVVSNGVLLCRTCDMASESVGRASRERARRPINFWVSRGLYTKWKHGLRTRDGFTSMGALVRYLMSKYMADADRFDDLELYQDEQADVKVNVWVEESQYASFRQAADERNMTVTGLLRALIRMYEDSAEPLVVRRV